MTWRPQRRGMRSALLGLLLVATGAAAEPPVEFTVLTYNTHGLAAWVAGDDPESRFPEIARHAGGYDLVLLQEDFAHHELLRDHTHHRVIQRGSPNRLGWLCPPCGGDGLTLLARLDPRRILDLARVPYGRCAGWLGGANDCLATKGFVRARIEFPGLGEVDFVNTHLDAGGDESDRAVRAEQLDAMRRHLEAVAHGRALVVAGDLNLHWDDPADRALLDPFVAGLGLVDSGAVFAPGGDWSRIDYLFVRSGEDVTLEVLEAGEATEFVGDQGPLSDHPALFARVRVLRRDDARRADTATPGGAPAPEGR